MSRSSRLIVGLALGACCLAIGASQASASHVSCFDVITEDTTLDSDLDCLRSVEVPPALTIAADGITLDLGGHSVSSNGVGVLNDGHDGVTITNGSVNAALSGLPILLSHADDNRIEHVGAGGGGGGPGALLDDSDDNRVVRSSFGGDAGGLTVTNGSDRNLIERNVLAAGLGFGLNVSDSDDNLIRRNRFNVALAAGLDIRSGSDATTVTRNEFRGKEGGSPSGDGIVVEAGTTNTLLARNQVSDWVGCCFGFIGNGIRVESAYTTLTRNSSNDNAGWGIFAVPGVIDGGRNKASGNLVGQCLNVSC